MEYFVKVLKRKSKVDISGKNKRGHAEEAPSPLFALRLTLSMHTVPPSRCTLPGNKKAMQKLRRERADIAMAMHRKAKEVGKKF